MDAIKQFIESLQENPIFYWLGALIGIVLILAIRLVLVKFIKRHADKEKHLAF